MNIFLGASSQDLEDREGILGNLVSLIRSSKLDLADTWIVNKIEGIERDPKIKNILESHVRMLLDSDAVILEISRPSFGVGYFFGLAVSNHKPVLCLYKESIDVEQISDVVLGFSSALVYKESYNLDNIEGVVNRFFKEIKKDKPQKFNFIATSKISKEIEKRANKEHKTKSEYLRDLLTREFF